MLDKLIGRFVCTDDESWRYKVQVPVAYVVFSVCLVAQKE